MKAHKDRMEVEYPPLPDYCDWLIKTAQSIGLTVGDRSITSFEVLTWRNFSGTPLTMWEVETISNLASIYVNAIHTMTDEAMLPPWMPEGKRERIEKQIAEFDAW